MIRRLLTAIRKLIARHHDRKASAAGTATLAAQIDRDWRAAGRHMRAMHAAQARRDALLRGGAVCCNHDCRQGRDCPLRA